MKQETEKQLRDTVLEYVKEIENGVKVTEQNTDEYSHLQVGDSVAAYDYQKEFLDTEFRVGGDSVCRGARISLRLGNPNIYLDTSNMRVYGSWGLDEFSVVCDKDAMSIQDWVDSAFGSMMNRKNLCNIGDYCE